MGKLNLKSRHRVLCGDSTKPDDVARLMNGRLADAFVSDPPYGVGYVGKTAAELPVHNDGSAGLADLLGSALPLASNFCKPGACWYVAAPAGPQFFEFAKVLLQLEIWRQTIVWAKQSIVMGHSDYHYQHELLFYGWKPGAAHQEPPDRKQTTLWQIDRPTASREHPTMKPIALFAKAIQNSTYEDNLVLDLFLGSGTNIVASEQLRRSCYGIELGPEYVDVTIRRWQQLTGGEAIREDGVTYNSLADAAREAGAGLTPQDGAA